jgi:hypothetical protein
MAIKGTEQAQADTIGTGAVAWTAFIIHRRRRDACGRQQQGEEWAK